MRKYYPYLMDDSFDAQGTLQDKRSVLVENAKYPISKRYVRLTLLNWDEEPIREVQGELTSGNLTKDGSSSVRCTCSLSATIDANSYDPLNVDADFSINKKIFLEIGEINRTDAYQEYPIFWFPQGVFFISSFSCSSSTTNVVTIQLSLKDKMCGLNGTVGGKFPAAVILDEMDTQDETGAYVTKKVKICDMIKELVNHYGGESLENIVIEDVPTRIKQVVKWMGENPLYLRKMTNTYGYTTYDAYLEKPDDMSGVLECPVGTDVGYIYRSLTYSGELSFNLGDSVTTALDKIKSYLGNYEYFYDEFGVFHFREIKNYLNTTQSTTLLNDMSDKNYLADFVDGKSVYAFSDKSNIISLSLTPQYDNIKNDFIIQGKRQGTSDNQTIDVRYRLVIDKKPTVGNAYHDLLLYHDPDTNETKATFPLSVDARDSLPQPGNFNIIYRVRDEENCFVFWKGDIYADVDVVKYYPSAIDDPVGYVTKDWRTELYLQGMLGKNNGTDQGYYFSKVKSGDPTDAPLWMREIARQNKTSHVDTDLYFEELDAFWPQMYDLENQKFYGEESEQEARVQTLTDGNYYIDFIDPVTSGLGKYSVQNIGRRTDAVSSDEVNCLFTPEIPDVIWLDTDDDDIVENRNECIIKGMPYSQVNETIYNNLYLGGYKNGAFDYVKSELWAHTMYQSSISITAMPVFYLQPNSRITINDSTTNVNGDYMINTITIPLAVTNNMSVTCTQCVEKM